MLTPEQQAAFVEELPEIFLPVAGEWGQEWGHSSPAGGSHSRTWAPAP